MTKFQDLTENYKLGKLLKERASTSKETKEKLNEMSTYLTTYALSVLSETCKDKKVERQDIEKVFRSLNKE
jgi:hypothetical protein